MQEIGSVTIGLEARVFDTEFADLDTPAALRVAGVDSSFLHQCTSWSVLGRLT